VNLQNTIDPLDALRSDLEGCIDCCQRLYLAADAGSGEETRARVGLALLRAMQALGDEAAEVLANEER